MATRMRRVVDPEKGPVYVVEKRRWCFLPWTPVFTSRKLIVAAKEYIK